MTDFPTHRTCSSCQELLERRHYAKKEYIQSKSEYVCKSCQQRATAERTKQPVAKKKLEGRVAASGMVRKPNNFGYCDYVDRLFGLKCFKDIVQLGVFTSAKDVSESMAALHAASRHGNISLSSKQVHCWCVGDGSTPRSAVLAAFMKGWTCTSIDPALQPKWHGKHPLVRGLTGFCGTFEEFVATQQHAQEEKKETDNSDESHLVLLCVHSHARFQGRASIENICTLYPKTTVVSLPCCPKFRHVGDIGRPPNVQYEDDCVFSACRQADVWNFE